MFPSVKSPPDGYSVDALGFFPCDGAAVRNGVMSHALGFTELLLINHGFPSTC
ncbi:hypothetical protein [Atlantibacter subterraneus]|uniref:hypothetical protein n=1 Tax=Atlantibacter subterraneus TaxID=255519 RepID=UPI00163AC88E|nr:hypothetical protein [Atlantibacter subterranea]